jgi:signal transduction histidine kinase
MLDFTSVIRRVFQNISRIRFVPTEVMLLVCGVLFLLSSTFILTSETTSSIQTFISAPHQNTDSTLSAKRNREIERLQYIQQLQDLELRRQTALRNALLVGMFLLVVIVVILTNRNLLKKRITADLTSKNQALSYANNEIVRQQRILEDQAAEIELANSELHEYNLQLRTLNQEIELRIAELETIDSIVHAINQTINFRELLQNLIQQGKKLLPVAEKGSVLVLNHKTTLYEFQAFLGLKAEEFQGIALTHDEIHRRYLHYASVDEGVHVITEFPDTTSAGQKFSNVQAPECALMVTIPIDGVIEGIVFFDVYTAGYTFSEADIVRCQRFRQHIITAFTKARALESLHSFAEKLSQQNMTLHDMNMEKNDFLGLVAHDLKNPLTQIMLSAGKIHQYFDRMSKDDVLRSMEYIETTSRRMGDIITNLLDVNAIETDLQTASYENVNFVEVVESVLQDLRSHALSKNIMLDFHTTFPEITILANKLSVRSIIENLCSNAVKYSFPDTQVDVRVTEHHEHFRFAVQDKGAGIPIEEQHRLFEKFARLSTKPTGGEHSTGLGLSIVKKLVTSMNGKVWCESKQGEGATFIVELPKVTELQEQQKPRA